MDDVKIIEEIVSRFREAQNYWDTEYDDALDDLRFANGDQWPSALKADRESDGRPCLTINKVAVFGDQVIGDIRQNEPSIKIKPVDSGSDPDVAEILTGLVRNIEVQSNAEIAYDTAAESAVWCGHGAFRIITEYSDDSTFDQDIRIKRIKNPFTVYWDPAAQEWDKSDARFVFITEKIPKEIFTELYPDAAVVDAPGKKDSNVHWNDGKSIRVAEYFKKEAKTSTLYLLQNPETGEKTTNKEKLDGWIELNKREITTQNIVHYKTNGREILDGPNDWPGKHFPICGVWGKEINIEGESHYRGIIRHAKDPQRLYNYSRSQGAELTSLAPKVPLLATSKMVGNYLNIWNQAHKKSFPFLPFDVDPQLPAFPKRADPVAQNTAITQEIMISDQELHDTTGLQQASLGKKSNEQSGRAILARQREGDVANYAYYDNLGRAVSYCGRVLLDLIPKIYDTARIVRILGEDGSERFVPINQPVEVEQPDGSVIERVFDLTTGKYDVVVSIGPSYSTQRDEAAENMIALMNAAPQVAPLIADLFVRNQDWPGAEEISERLKAMLPPQVAGGQGQPPPGPPVDPMDQMKKQAEIEGILIDNRGKSVDIARREMGADEGQEQ